MYHYSKEKADAISLRISGLSYSEISRKLGIPKGTLSAWFSEKNWSKEIRNKLEKVHKKMSTERLVLMNIARKEALRRLYLKSRKEAEEEISLYMNDPLFVAGLSIYWGEGDKRNKQQLRISNSDYEIIRVFLLFLRKYMPTYSHRIRAGLILYNDIIDIDCKRFWSQKISLEEKYFTKSVYIKGRHKINRVSNGICVIGISSRFLKEKMLEWLRLFPREFK